MRSYILLIILTCVTACYSAPSGSTQPSGFIGEQQDYQKMQQRADGSYFYIAPGKSLNQYKAFYVEEVQVLMSGQGRSLSEDREIDAMARTLREKIIRALGNKHTMFNQPARDVGIIRVAVTDLNSKSLVASLRPELIHKSNTGGAAIEAHVIDSMSGEKVATFADSKVGERSGYLSGMGKWSGTKAAFDRWAMNLARSVK